MRCTVQNKKDEWVPLLLSATNKPAALHDAEEHCTNKKFKILGALLRPTSAHYSPTGVLAVALFTDKIISICHRQ